MIYGERTRRKMTRDPKGMTGTVTMVADWSDIETSYHPSLPKVGDLWSALYPYLVCQTVEAEEIGGGVGEVTAQFSTDRKLGEDWYETSVEYDFESVDVTEGYTWETAQTPVEEAIPTVIPVPRYNITMKQLSAPRYTIMAAQGKVNSKRFHGWAAETLRFDGANTDETYDQDGNLLSVKTTYRFTGKTDSHNYAWRKALQLRDADGNLYYWQNKDNTKPYYTLDQKKIGTRVYVDGTPGTAGWDKPKFGSEYKYLTCDFELVLGIPGQAGDD